jgi:hypothetical protein
MLTLAMVFGSLSMSGQDKASTAHLPKTFEPCNRNCLVTFEGLQSSYRRGDHAKVSIRNETKEQIDVVVAVEGQLGTGWAEVTSSVLEPERPMAKIVKGTFIQAGKAKIFSYDPWTALDAWVKAAPLAGRPTLFQLRVYVYSQRDFIQMAESKTFQLLETETPH